MMLVGFRVHVLSVMHCEGMNEHRMCGKLNRVLHAMQVWMTHKVRLCLTDCLDPCLALSRARFPV